MDKYSVDTTKENIKTANNGCPKCGGKLEDNNQSICSKCGSEPFEKESNIKPAGIDFIRDQLKDSNIYSDCFVITRQ